MSPAPSGTQGTLTDASCSRRALREGEPLAGTAPEAKGWVILEEPGPWGRDALSDSPIPRAVVEWSEQLRAEHSIRTIAARHPSRRRLDRSEPRNVWLAMCEPGHQQLRNVQVMDLQEVCEWDQSPFSAAELPDVGRLLEQPVEFICTHSARDTCCAVLGRQALARTAHAWECSHLGGHRFAATSLVLPEGNCFGRLAPDDDRDTSHLRGATHLPPDLQVAEIAVRTHLGLGPSTPLRTTPGPEADTAEVRDTEGNGWLVRCEQDTMFRPASCHAEPSESRYWQAVLVEPWKESYPHGH